MSCAARIMSPIPACSCRCSMRSARRAPAFAHAALLTGSEGKLSKRLGSLGVEAMREAGIEPQALVAKLARIGTSLPVEPLRRSRAADRELRFRQLRPRPGPLRHGGARGAQRQDRPPARFRRGARPAAGRDERGGLGGDPAEPAPRSPRPPTGGTSSTAMSSRPPRRRTAPISPPPPRPPPRSTGADAPWPALTARLKETSGRAGKALFHPLRRALTGRDSGPGNGGVAAPDRPRRGDRPPRAPPPS